VACDRPATGGLWLAIHAGLKEKAQDDNGCITAQFRARCGTVRQVGMGIGHLARRLAADRRWRRE
jgi:hypothetical protein